METNDKNSQLDVSPQTTRLVEVLQTLELQIKKQTSLKYAFLRGMAYGLGTVIGATILVALFGGIIASTISSLTGEIITAETLEQKI